MNSLYAILLLGSALVPLALSFDKNLQFYKQWKYLLPAIVAIAILYIIFDVILTNSGVWGFNPNYHFPITVFGLPIEEYLFFIVIPYASIFLHDSIKLYFEQLKLSNTLTRIVSISLIAISLALIITNTDKTYTTYILIKMIIVLSLSFFDKTEIMNRFYITFFIILIPFVMVNGVLTGSFIEEPVVWYNNLENLGIRIFTIPIEDSVYAFSLLAFVLLLRTKLKFMFNKNTNKN